MQATEIRCPHCGNVAATLTYAEPDDGTAATLQFGQLTKASHGGVEILGAVRIGGDDFGHWQILENDFIAPTAAGADNLAGPYDLTIEFENGTKLALRIEIEPDVYDVASLEELLEVLPQGVAPALVNGKTVMLRPGQFGNPDAGTLTILQKVYADPATPLTVTSREPHTLWVGAHGVQRELGNPGILPKLRLLRCSGIVFAGIGFHHNFYPGATTGESMVLLSLELDGIVFDGCNIWCQEGVTDDKNINAIGTDGNANATTRNVTIRNCAIHDARSLLNSMSPGMIVEGNYLYNAHVDFIHLGVLACHSKIKWNVLYRPTIDSSQYHPDFIQTIVAGKNENLDGVELIGNRCFTGDITQSSQGFYFDNFKDGNGVGTGRHTNLTVKGNLLVGLAGRGISIGLNGDNPIENVAVVGNTVVRDKRLAADANVTVGILLHSDTVDCVVKNNVAEQITEAKPGLTNENNVVLGENGSVIPYPDAFAGNSDQDFMPDDINALMTHYAMRPEGELDLLVPVGAVGTGYVDWENRILNTAME